MRSIFLLLTVCASPLFADEKKPVDQKPLDASFLRLYAETRGFMLGRPAKPKPTPDGKAVLFLRSEPKKPKQSLYEFDVASGKTRELLTPESLLKGAEENLTPEEKARRERQRVSVGGFSDYQLNDDGSKVLVGLSGKLYVFDRSATRGVAIELKTGKGTLLDPKWSPDGRKVSYVLDHDVYVYDLATNKETPVTRGGTEVKTHGLAEFVAQEEMGRFSGYWWSPDSKFIACEEADHEGVEQWYVADPNKPDQKPLPQYYPRPGKKNVAVHLGIVPIAGGETVWVDWDRKKFEYLAAVRWDKVGPLTIQVQDRKQKELVLLLVDAKTGKTNALLSEKDQAFVNITRNTPYWVSEKEGFFWFSEVEGGSEVTLRDREGNKKPIITSEAVQGFVSFDSARDRVILRVSRGEPGHTRFVHVKSKMLEDESQPIIRRTLAPVELALGHVDVTYAIDHSAFALTRSTTAAMPITTVRVTGVPELQVLPSVAVEPDFSPNIEFGKVADFFTAIIRPSNFNPTKKYPVVLDVYGGPHHLHVTQEMRPWLLKQWLADRGFIVVAIDNRGTPGRGRDWERAIYQKFDSVPLDDQIAGLKLLGEKHPEMDMERVGIVGWSFGGYMSALAVLKRPDVFKAAVAGAPVTDWEDYDSHYTERYLGTLPESQDAYDRANLVKMADKLTRPLLLVHGTADDNVYFRHTLKLTDALFRAGKDFEVLPLPSLTHMVPDPVVTEKLWTRIAGHFQKHLGKPK